MNVSVKVEGLEEAMQAMLAAFPVDERKQRGILNASMRAAATGTILADAKQRASAGDASGALSESLGIRATSKKKLKMRNVVAGVEIVPIRTNMKAMALYIQHYYTSRGKIAPAKMFTSGIRHGHLIEFGTAHSAADPFLYPAAQAAGGAYVNRFAADLSKKTEAAVKREAKKR
jgi:hypothetical protein